MNKTLFLILLIFLMSCGQETTTETKTQVQNEYGVSTAEKEEYKKLIDAFNSKDSLYIIKYIDKIDSLSYPEFAYRLMDISDVTGFSWGALQYCDKDGIIKDYNNAFEKAKTEDIIIWKLYCKSELFLKDKSVNFMTVWRDSSFTIADSNRVLKAMNNLAAR